MGEAKRRKQSDLKWGNSNIKAIYQKSQSEQTIEQANLKQEYKEYLEERISDSLKGLSIAEEHLKTIGNIYRHGIDEKRLDEDIEINFFH